MCHVCHAVDKIGDTRIRFKCATETVCDTGGARTTPIPSQRTRLSSVGKTPSFRFSQADMYELHNIGEIISKCETILSVDSRKGTNWPLT